MRILDSDGKLFGYVNVIDALAVVLVVAVAVAGVALVAGSESPDTSQSAVSAEFATVAIGPVSDDTAALVARADTLPVVGSDRSLNVTDVVRMPHPTSDGTAVLARVRVPEDAASGSLSEGFAVSVGRFSYNATLSSPGNGSTLETERTAVTVETAVSEQVAGAVSSGDTFRLGDTTVATITGVQRLEAADGTRRLRVALDVRAVRIDGTDSFARRPLRLGSSLPFRTDAYSFTGTVVSRSGRLFSSRNVTVQAEATVPDTVAETVEAGDEFRIDATSVARLQAVSVLPTRGPRSTLVMTLSLQATTRDDRTQFFGRSVQPGASIPFRTAEYTLEPTITSLRPEPVRRQTLTTRLQATVPEAVADAVTQGDTYRLDNRTVAEIRSVTAYPVAESSDRRLVVTAELRTVLEDGTPQFLDTPVRVGRTVTFETPSYQFDATVVTQNDSAPGSPVDATLDVEWENVSPELADAVRPGLAEGHRGADARISAVEREPATVILQTERGEIFARDHPVNEDVTLTLAVETRRTDGSLSFHGRSVQTGDSIVLDFGSVTVHGTVVDVAADG